jgi:hypothetical protein
MFKESEKEITQLGNSLASTSSSVRWGPVVDVTTNQPPRTPSPKSVTTCESDVVGSTDTVLSPPSSPKCAAAGENDIVLSIGALRPPKSPPKSPPRSPPNSQATSSPNSQNHSSRRNAPDTPLNTTQISNTDESHRLFSMSMPNFHKQVSTDSIGPSRVRSKISLNDIKQQNMASRATAVCGGAHPEKYLTLIQHSEFNAMSKSSLIHTKPATNVNAISYQNSDDNIGNTDVHPATHKDKDKDLSSVSSDHNEPSFIQRLTIRDLLIHLRRRHTISAAAHGLAATRSERFHRLFTVAILSISLLAAVGENIIRAATKGDDGVTSNIVNSISFALIGGLTSINNFLGYQAREQKHLHSRDEHTKVIKLIEIAIAYDNTGGGGEEYDFSMVLEEIGQIHESLKQSAIEIPASILKKFDKLETTKDDLPAFVHHAVDIV